jgi:hypothetical protein
MEDLDYDTKQYANMYKKGKDVFTCGDTYGGRSMYPNTALSVEQNSAFVLYKHREQVPRNMWGKKHITPDGSDKNMYKLQQGNRYDIHILKTPQVDRFYNSSCL